MPIGTGIIYNVGDLILSQVSGSGTAFLETKIAAATSSLIYFDSTAKINSASLNSITVGTASYVSGSTSIITNLTASNISASGTSSFGYVGIGTTSPNDLLHLRASSATAYDATSDNGQFGSGAGITIENRDETSQSFAQVNLQVSGNAGRALGRIVAIRTASATSDLAFVTENANTKAEKMRILSDGNVGIGTTAPGARLEISSSTAASLLNVKGAGGNGILFVSGSGLVGIGTTAPGALLDVNGLFRFQQDIRVNNGTDKLILSATSTTTELHSAGTTGIVFKNSGNNEIVRFDAATGNVGIGTTNPEQKLHVRGYQVFLYNDLDANNTYFYARNSGAGNAGIKLKNSDGEWTIIANDRLRFIDDDAGVERLSILSDGNVGIGTTSPTGSLQVNKASQTLGATTPSGATIISNLAGGNGILELGVDTTNLAYIQSRNITDQTYYKLLLNPSGGSVGIGTTAPGALLEISSSTAASLLNVKGAGGNGILFVSGSGLVGIGTTSPVYPLEVSSTAILSIAYQRTGVSAKKWGFDSDNSNTYWVNLTDSVRSFTLSNTGNVGIGVGVGNPAYTLDVSGNLRISGSGSTVGTFKSSASSCFISLVDSSGDSVFLGNDDGDFLIQTPTSGYSTKLIVKDDGNVGIGTTSPATNLEIYKSVSVAGESYQDILTVTTVDNDGGYFYTGLGAGIAFRSGKTSANVYGPSIMGSIYGANSGDESIANGYLSFHTRNSNTVAERMRITNNGNVGIGTTIPAVKLHVDGFFISKTLWSDTAAHSYWGSYSTAYGRLTWDTGLAWINATAGNVLYLGANGDNKHITIATSGNVGIGTTNPAATLQVAGNISGSSFTSSISNAVGFLGTSSWASNAVTSLVCTGNAATATTASYANALNDANSYTVVDVNTTGNIRLRNGDPTITLSDTNDSSSFIHVDGNYFSILCGPPNASFGEWVVPANGRWPMEISLTNNTSTFGGSLDAISFTGSGSGLFGTAAGLSIGGTAATASYANALNTGNSYTISGLTNNSTLSQQGTLSMGSGYQILATTGTAPIPGISFVGDTNTGIYAPSADTLGFSISGSERVRIDSNGNVGIGTTSPLAKLSVGNGSLSDSNLPVQISTAAASGTAYFGANKNGAYGALFGFDNAGYAGVVVRNVVSAGSSGDAISFVVNNTTTAVYIKSDGNVGIGTTSPGAKLQVDVSSASGIRVNGTGGYANILSQGGHLEFYKDSTPTYAAAIGLSTPATALSNDIQFATYNGSSWSARMTIANGGNVGIGTTNPSGIFHAANLGTANTTADNFSAYFSSVNRNASIFLLAKNTEGSAFYFGDGDSNTVGALVYEHTTNYLRVDVNGSERMRINSDGNVGIGTTSPAAKLSVNGVSSFGLSSKLSMIGLDINSGVTPTYVKIVTTIPFASTAADFTVNIKGFIYGSQRAADISICWHYYNSTFYNPIAKSSGGWAPTIRLSAEGGFVAIVLSSPGYWPKFYVESMYSSAYNNQYVSDWSWVDADATGSPIVNVSYASNFGNSFVMLDNGNVGINQTSPTTPLHVVGVISGSSFTGAGTGLTGTAASLTAGAVTNGVYTTGDQSVGGVKSFTSTMNVTGVRETMTTVAAATNVAINLNLGTIFKLTFSSTVSTFTITNTDNTNVAAGNSFTLISAPDNSNAKTIAFSFITNGAAATAVKWATFAGGTTPTATITSGKFDVFSFVYDGVNWYGFTGGLTY